MNGHRHPICGRAAGALALALALATAGCSAPGKLYEISPLLRGQLEGLDADGASLELVVRSRNTSTLGSRSTSPVDGEGRFTFQPVSVQVAGLEFDKLYRVYLYVRRPARDPLVVWRAEWRRGDANEPIDLECDAARPPQEGQRCRVQNGVEHAWLVWHGELEFGRYCASCHGAEARGDGPAAAALATRPADLTQLATRRGGRFDRASVLRFIDGRDRPSAHGSREMPVWGPRLASELGRYVTAEDMAAARLDAIVTFLESVQRPAPVLADGR